MPTASHIHINHRPVRFSEHTNRILYTSLLLRDYSGRKLTRLGSAVDWSFLISLAVTLQDSKDRDLRFFNDLICTKPALLIRELEMLSETKPVKPVIPLSKPSVFRKKTTMQLITFLNDRAVLTRY